MNSFSSLQTTKQSTIIAIIAAGPQRLAALLAPHLSSARYVVVFNPVSGEAPLLPDVDSKLFEGMLGNEEGEAELICYSLPGLFSLRSSTSALQEIFPGLQENARHMVPQFPVTILSDILGAEVDALTLVIDLPGEELTLLSLIESHGILKDVRKLKIRCGAERFFQDAIDADEAAVWLAERGFDLVKRDDTDSSWPLLDFMINPMRRHAIELEEKKSQLNTKIDQLKVEAEERAKQIQAIRSKLEATQIAAQDMATEHSTIIETLRSEAEQNSARLKEAQDRLQANQATAKRSKDAAAKSCAVIEKLKTKLSQTAQHLEVAEDQLKASQLATAAAQKVAAERGDAIDKLKAQAANSSEQLQATEFKLQASQKAADDARKEAAERNNIIEKLKARAQASQKAADNAQKSAADRSTVIKKFKAQAVELSQRLHTMEDDMRRLRITMRGGEEATQRALAELNRTRTDHSTLLTMFRTQAEELSRLRLQYTKIFDEKNALQDLLEKLTHRLQEAAGKLRALALLPNPHPNTTDEPIRENQKSSQKKKALRHEG